MQQYGLSSSGPHPNTRGVDTVRRDSLATLCSSRLITAEEATAISKQQPIVYEGLEVGTELEALKMD